MRTVPAAPHASVLIESMRDIGYRLETALADIVDNSITAQATTIHLLANTGGEGPASIAVLDDGVGMSEEELLAAMPLGSRSPREYRAASDLGRFGLGLKTASFSQCRRLTLVSRKDGRTSAARWDLDRVARSDEWLVEIPDDTERIPWISRLGEVGTLVVWENLDRIIEHGGGSREASYFVQRLDSVRGHLELVFHRFLGGDTGLSKVKILLNERPLEGFDPFHRKSPATIHWPIETIRVGNDDVIVQAFTLPHHEKVDAPEWERYAGLRGYVRESGFYVYRGGRLIIHGTWFGLARQMELTKLARVRIDIPNSLDAAWKIDILKASAQPPFQVRERLRRIIEEMSGASKRVYRSRGRRLASDDRLPVWNRVQDKGEIVYELNAKHPMITKLLADLPESLVEEFRRVLNVIGATLPMDALYADMGSEPQKVRGNELDDETLGHAVRVAHDELRRSGLDREAVLDRLAFAEPFRSNWARTEKLLGSISDHGDRCG